MYYLKCWNFVLLSQKIDILNAINPIGALYICPYFFGGGGNILTEYWAIL
jgi:hypothetical protein